MRRTLRILSRRSVPRRAAPFAPGVASRGRRPCLVTGGAHAALTRPSRGRARPLRTEARAVFSGARRESRALRRARLPSGARRESLVPSLRARQRAPVPHIPSSLGLRLDFVGKKALLAREEIAYRHFGLPRGAWPGSAGRSSLSPSDGPVPFVLPPGS